MMGRLGRKSFAHATRFVIKADFQQMLVACGEMDAAGEGRLESVAVDGSCSAGQ
jgi:hypothetical protein